MVSTTLIWAVAICLYVVAGVSAALLHRMICQMADIEAEWADLVLNSLAWPISTCKVAFLFLRGYLHRRFGK